MCLMFIHVFTCYGVRLVIRPLAHKYTPGCITCQRVSPSSHLWTRTKHHETGKVSKMGTVPPYSSATHKKRPHRMPYNARKEGNTYRNTLKTAHTGKHPHTTAHSRDTTAPHTTRREHTPAHKRTHNTTQRTHNRTTHDST